MKKLLIIDDSKELLDAMKLYLEQNDFVVLTISEKEDIIPFVKSFNPDMVIMDILINENDGKEVCKELRRHVDTKYLCILMFSASSEVLDNYGTYGADGCIEKPFGLNNIIDKIKFVFDCCKDHDKRNIDISA